MNDMTRPLALPVPSALEAFLRRRLLAQLAPLQGGRLQLRAALGDVSLGDAEAPLQVTVWVQRGPVDHDAAVGGGVDLGNGGGPWPLPGRLSIDSPSAAQLPTP